MSIRFQLQTKKPTNKKRILPVAGTSTTIKELYSRPALSQGKRNGHALSGFNPQNA